MSANKKNPNILNVLPFQCEETAYSQPSWNIGYRTGDIAMGGSSIQNPTRWHNKMKKLNSITEQAVYINGVLGYAVT